MNAIVVLLQSLPHGWSVSVLGGLCYLTARNEAQIAYARTLPAAECRDFRVVPWWEALAI